MNRYQLTVAGLINIIQSHDRNDIVFLIGRSIDSISIREKEKRE